MAASSVSSFDACLAFALERIGKQQLKLKREQVASIRHVYDGKDVFYSCSVPCLLAPWASFWRQGLQICNPCTCTQTGCHQPSLELVAACSSYREGLLTLPWVWTNPAACLMSIVCKQKRHTRLAEAIASCIRSIQLPSEVSVYYLSVTYL